jgi:hypothetical protein
MTTTLLSINNDLCHAHNVYRHFGDVMAVGVAARRRMQDEFSPARYLERIRAVYQRLGATWP